MFDDFVHFFDTLFDLLGLGNPESFFPMKKYSHIFMLLGCFLGKILQRLQIDRDHI